MTMIHAACVIQAQPAPPGVGGDVITLSGQTVFKFAFSPTDSFARLKVDDDGIMYESEDNGAASWSPIDTPSNWIDIKASAPGLYEVRYTALAGDALDFNTAAEDAWHSLSDGDFILYQSVVGIGDQSSTFTLQIRLDGGPVLASASYTLNAEVDSGA